MNMFKDTKTQTLQSRISTSTTKPNYGIIVIWSSFNENSSDLPLYLYIYTFICHYVSDAYAYRTLGYAVWFKSYLPI